MCLIRPRAAEAFRFSAQSLSLPLGLAYLAAALEQAGHEVSVLDAVGLAPDRRQRYVQGYLVGMPDDELVARVPAGAAVIGVSVLFTHEWPAVVRLLAALRAGRPLADVPGLAFYRPCATRAIVQRIRATTPPQRLSRRPAA